MTSIFFLFHCFINILQKFLESIPFFVDVLPLLKLLKLQLVFSLFFNCLFVCFSKVFPKGESVNLACSIALLWSGDSYCWYFCCLYVSISCYSFSSLILSFVMISFCILSKRSFLKRKILSEARVVSIWLHGSMNIVWQYVFSKDSCSRGTQYLMNDYVQFVEALTCLEIL